MLQQDYNFNIIAVVYGYAYLFRNKYLFRITQEATEYDL